MRHTEKKQKKCMRRNLSTTQLTMPPVYVQKTPSIQNKDQLLNHVDDLLLQLFAL